ncbi:MAG: alpha/beta fold hydrolase [Gallionella sp.]
MKTWQRRLILVVGGSAVLYLAACLFMWGTQVDQVFQPSPILQTNPARMGMSYQEVHVPVGENGLLDGFWVPATQANAPTFLYFHGNYRNIGNNLDHTQRLHQLGYNVLLVDYRGYGRSVGAKKPSEAQVYADAEATWQYLTKVRGISPKQVFIYGHSLGGGIAINLATHHPEAAGLITESTFTSMSDMGKLDYAFLPIDWLLNQRFESLQKVPSLKLPVLFIHGTWDPKIPVEMAKQLYAAAPQPKTLLLIEGGEHNNTGAIGWVEYQSSVTAFVQQNFKRM